MQPISLDEALKRYLNSEDPHVEATDRYRQPATTPLDPIHDATDVWLSELPMTPERVQMTLGASVSSAVAQG